MFVSPITTKEERKKSDKDDLLVGNLFTQEGLQLSSPAYRSLLETVALHPKKKHFKKVLEHMFAYEDKKNVDGKLIDLITFIGIEQKYPVLLGTTMKFML